MHATNQGPQATQLLGSDLLQQPICTIEELRRAHIRGQIRGHMPVCISPAVTADEQQILLHCPQLERPAHVWPPCSTAKTDLADLFAEHSSLLLAKYV